MPKKEKLKVVELFAGVGGFRLGLEGWKGKSSSSGYTKRMVKNYETIWSNQWEPGAKVQHASNVYREMFGNKGHSNEDIGTINPKSVPKHDLLVGGFPCQDYSVAKQLGKSKGIKGKKGVLWWNIRDILEAKKPKYVLLENVDRLISSPANQRGRDFAIILASLSDLDYMVEWRIINAADYGMPQRRRRVFIFAYHKKTSIYKKYNSPSDWIYRDGLIAKTFKIEERKQLTLFKDKGIRSFKLTGNLVQITNKFNKLNKESVFENSGIMIDREVWTVNVQAKYSGLQKTLKDILVGHNEVEEEFYINRKDIKKWRFLKGAKKKLIKNDEDKDIYWSEGSMSFPDDIHKPLRTIVTGEGGPSPSRFKHIIKSQNQYRRLVPKELERANMFPDDFTKSASNTKRSFFMGNALVIGIIEKLGKELSKRHFV